MPDPTPSLPIDPATLVDRVRAAIGRPRATLESWVVTPVEYPNFSGGARAVHRVSGVVRDGGSVVPWSMIVKAFELQPAEKEVEANDIPFGYAYWKREPLAFESRVFDGLSGGLRAPDCYGVDRPTTKSALVWLEELADESADAWSIERYGTAARHLGAFNGAYLAGAPLPDQPWLASAHSVNEYWTVHPDTSPRLDVLRDPDRWATIGTERLGADAEIGNLRAFLDQRSAMHEAIDRLPQVVCHNDAMRSNLFAARAPDGTDRTAAIDWALMGIGPVGGDVALLVAGSVMFFKAAAADLRELGEIAVAGYMRGLTDAGASIDEAAARFGYAACSVLRMTAIVGTWIQLALDPADADWAADFWGRPVADLLAAWGPLLGYLDGQAAYALASPLRG